MKARLLLLLCAVGTLAAADAFAAPAPTDKNANGPAVSLQVEPIDELLATVKQAAKNLLPEPLYKEFEKNALSKLDLNQIKGIDTKRPMGLYATLGPGLVDGDFSKTSIVALIPVTSEKEFLVLLEKIDLKPVKNDGYYTIAIPDAPVEGTLRFWKGFAYIGISPDKLELKSLLDPAEVFSEKETSAIALRVRVDRLPKEVKEPLVALLSKTGEMLSPKDGPGREIVDEIFRTGLRWLKLALDDGKELALKVDLDLKAGSLVIETSLDAKSATTLAKSFNALKPTKNEFGGIVGSDSAAQLLIQTPLFVEDIQSVLVKLLGWGIKEADANLGVNEPKEIKDLILEALHALQRTVKSGTFDFAASLRGPDKNDQYTAIGAISIKGTAPLEKAVRAALKIAPPNDAAKFKLDSFKIGDINVHEILVADDLPMGAQKIFGKSNVLIAVAPNAVFATFGPQGKRLLEEALTSKLTPKAAPLYHMEVSGTRLLPLVKSIDALKDKEAKLLLEKLCKFDRLQVHSLKVEGGGDKLTIRYEIGLLPIGAAIYFLGVRANATFPVVPPGK